VKAGMDPVKLKRRFGARLALKGGLNAVHYADPERMFEEMRRVIPEMKRGGGYWVSSDHSVPETVSLEQFREFVRLAKELGSCE
jgi:uroporphyrinogen decarboxylase